MTLEIRRELAKAIGWELYASRDQFIGGMMQATTDVWVWEDGEGGTLEYPDVPDEETLLSQYRAAGVDLKPCEGSGACSPSD